MPTNFIREIFVGRIHTLMHQYAASKSVSHGPTVGAMREQMLREFMSEMLPQKFAPVSGFIVDSAGNITPQLDMIFIDRSELPTVTLVKDTVYVPAEIALLAVEVKSSITKAVLDQVEKQRHAIEQLRFDYLGSIACANATRSRKQIVPSIIIGFDSDLGEDTLSSWVTNGKGIAGICVINKLSICQVMGQGIKQVVLKNADFKDFEPLLIFIATLYRILTSLQINNSPLTDQELARVMGSRFLWFWESYLTDYMRQQLQNPAPR